MSMTRAALVAIDWGTTSARAYRMSATGDVLAARSGPFGISHIHDGRFGDALARLLEGERDEKVPRIACGMIGSRQGWVEAAYLPCPAPVSELAAGLVRTPEGELSVVPGVCTRDASGLPDVMRGEETQIVGVVDASEARVLVAMPGTHSKWAFVESGRIVDFMTFMTGEIWHVLLAHSILGRLAVQARDAGEIGPGFLRGAARGLASGSIAHDAFGSRTLALMGELAGEDVADWLSGMLIGREVRHARQWAQRNGYDGARVRVIGDDALVARYATVLAEVEAKIERADSQAAAHGLWRIAVQAGLVNPLY